MANLDALKQDPDLAKEISAKALDTLVIELNSRGYSVTKDELRVLAKQQAGSPAVNGSIILYSHVLITG